MFVSPGMYPRVPLKEHTFIITLIQLMPISACRELKSVIDSPNFKAFLTKFSKILHLKKVFLKLINVEMLTKLSLKLNLTYSARSSWQKSENSLAIFESEIKLIKGAVLVSIFRALLEFLISSSSKSIHYCIRVITLVRIESYFVSTFGLVLL